MHDKHHCGADALVRWRSCGLLPVSQKNTLGRVRLNRSQHILLIWHGAPKL